LEISPTDLLISGAFSSTTILTVIFSVFDY